MLQLTNAGGDAMITQCIGNLNTYIQAIRAAPNTVVSETLDQMTIAQLESMSEIASMGNLPTTVSNFGKQVFSNDFAALSTRSSELGYLKAAQVAVGDLAMMSQYFSQSKPDVPKFRSDIIKSITRLSGAAGAAAANAAGATG